MPQTKYDQAVLTSSIAIVITMTLSSVSFGLAWYYSTPAVSAAALGVGVWFFILTQINLVRWYLELQKQDLARRGHR